MSCLRIFSRSPMSNKLLIMLFRRYLQEGCSCEGRLIQMRAKLFGPSSFPWRDIYTYGVLECYHHVGPNRSQPSQSWCCSSSSSVYPANKIQDFMRMNSSKFHVSKVDEDPQKFIDKAYKIVAIVGVSPMRRWRL